MCSHNRRARSHLVRQLRERTRQRAGVRPAAHSVYPVTIRQPRKHMLPHTHLSASLSKDTHALLLRVWRPQKKILTVCNALSDKACMTPSTNVRRRARTHPLLAEESLPGIALRPRQGRDLGGVPFQLCDEAAHTHPRARTHTHVRMHTSIRKIQEKEGERTTGVGKAFAMGRGKYQWKWRRERTFTTRILATICAKTASLAATHLAADGLRDSWFLSALIISGVMSSRMSFNSAS